MEEKNVQENFVVDSLDRERLDHFISNNFSTPLSRSFVQKLIKDKSVLVNGFHKKANYRICVDDQISVSFQQKQPTLTVFPENIPLDIVYEDEDLCVVNKGSNMVSHISPGHSEGTLVHALRYHCKTLSSLNGPLRPGIVHRLDKETSGLMIVAKNDTAHKSLAEQLNKRSLKRQYMAIVCGAFPEKYTQLSTNIGRHPKNRKTMTVLKTGGKKAITFFSVKKQFSKFTLLDVQLSTGRTHQIRVHLKHLGFPICGDPLYYASRSALFKTVSAQANCPPMSRQALHSYFLSFDHPSSKKNITISIVLPQDMAHFLDFLSL